MQEERYSPLYNKLVGIDYKCMISEENFRKKWIEEFDRNIEIILKRDPTFKFTPEEKTEAL
jgi:CRISPR/Cas system-associated exonuclease Cas4 (RecB family)